MTMVVEEKGMERKSIPCLSATGDSMTLEVVEHGEGGASKEFIIAAPKFNFKKWLSLTVLLSFVSLTCELYIADLRLLGAVLSLLCFALIVKLHKKIKLESLLVVSSLGLQHTTLYASGRRETFFLSRRRLKSVLIVEGITMQKVFFYLAIVINSDSAIPRHSTQTSSPSSFRDKLKTKPSSCQLTPVSNGSHSLYPKPVTDNISASCDTASPISDAASDVATADVDCGCRLGGGGGGTLHTDCCRISTRDIVYPLFQSLWPRLDVLTIIYRGVEKTIFQP